MDQFLGYLAIGVTQGLVYALLALGIVLIYKGSRVINFAHPYFGLLAAFVCWWLTERGPLPLAEGSRPRFLLAAFLTLILIAANGFGVEHNIMRRLRSAPRLMTLVATIALAQGTVGFVVLIFARNETQFTTARSLPTVLPWHFGVGTRIVTGADIQVLLLVPLICIGLGAFFRFTKFGIGVRAAAENGDAARLLGISVDQVSQFTWVVGSILAGLAGLLITEVRGSLDVASLSTGFLVRGLAVALVGGLTSLSGAVVGGLIVGVGEAMVQWLTSPGKPLDFIGVSGGPELLLFILIVSFLFVKPGGLFGRREETEDKVAFIPTLRELPARLRNTLAAKTVRIIGWAFVGVALLVPLMTGSRTNNTLVRVVIFAIVGVSLTVLMGFSGQISLGHWGLVGVGAFTAANLFSRMHVPYLLTLVLTVLVGMVVSLVIGLPALRIRGLYLAIVTLSFNLACEYYLFKTKLVAKGTSGVLMEAPKLGPIDLDSGSQRPMFYFAVFCLGLSLLVARNLARSGTGRGFFSLRENEKAAATLGVHLTKYRLLSFAVSGGIAALAGAVYVTWFGIAQSEQFPTGISLVLVAMVMIGGLGSLSGGILGSFLVIGLPELLDFANDWVVSIGTGILLLVVIVRAPGGLAGLIALIKRAVVEAIDDLSKQTPAPAPPPEPARTQ